MRSRILLAIALCAIGFACTDGQRAIIRGQKSYRITSKGMERGNIVGKIVSAGEPVGELRPIQ